MDSDPISKAERIALNFALFNAVDAECDSDFFDLLNAGADPNYFCWHKKEYVLMHAIAANSIGKVKLLLAFGADPNVRDPKVNYTPLMDAVFRGYDSIAEELLKNPKIDIRIKNIQGNTAFSFITYLKSMRVAKLMLEKGANVNDQDIYGWTPLMLAIKFNQENMLEVVKFLLANGADPLIRPFAVNSPGIVQGPKNAYELAISRHLPEVVDFIGKHLKMREAFSAIARRDAITSSDLQQKGRQAQW